MATQRRKPVKPLGSSVSVPGTSLVEIGVPTRFHAVSLKQVNRKTALGKEVFRRSTGYTSHAESALANGYGLFIQGRDDDTRRCVMYGIAKAVFAQRHTVLFREIGELVDDTLKKKPMDKVENCDLLVVPELDLPDSTVTSAVISVFLRIVRSRQRKGLSTMFVSALPLDDDDLSVDHVYPGIADVIHANCLFIGTDKKANEPEEMEIELATITGE